MDEDLKQYLDANFARVDARFAAIDAKLAAVDTKFGQVDTKFGQVDARFTEVRAQIEKSETNLLRAFHGWALVEERISDVERKQA
jgi:hypothetical protein